MLDNIPHEKPHKLVGSSYVAVARRAAEDIITSVGRLFCSWVRSMVIAENARLDLFTATFPLGTQDTQQGGSSLSETMACKWTGIHLEY